MKDEGRWDSITEKDSGTLHEMSGRMAMGDSGPRGELCYDVCNGVGKLMGRVGFGCFGWKWRMRLRANQAREFSPEAGIGWELSVYLIWPRVMVMLMVGIPRSPRSHQLNKPAKMNKPAKKSSYESISLACIIAET